MREYENESKMSFLGNNKRKSLLKITLEKGW